MSNNRFKRIKIFGERNTATNLLKRLIEKNSEAFILPSTARELDPSAAKKAFYLRHILKSNNLSEHYVDRMFADQPPSNAWKHCACYFEDVSDFDGCLVIFLVRNPVSWLLALFKKPYHALTPVPNSFKRFIAMRWRLLGRDKLPHKQLSPIELWNEKLRSYEYLIKKLQVNHQSFEIVRFEDIVTNQASVYRKLASRLYCAHEYPSIISESTKEKGKNIFFYKNYYESEAWRSEVSEECYEFLNKWLDKGLSRRFGYDIGKIKSESL